MWLPRDLLESFAWRALSENARRLIDRVLIEHMAHGGAENGALPVTYGDLASYGLRRNGILPAVAEAEALGLLERTEGYAIRGEFRGQAQRFRIAWMWTAQGEQPTERWRRFASLKEATTAGTEARRVGVDSRRIRPSPRDIEGSLASETSRQSRVRDQKRA